MTPEIVTGAEAVLVRLFRQMTPEQRAEFLDAMRAEAKGTQIVPLQPRVDARKKTVNQ